MKAVFVFLGVSLFLFSATYTTEEAAAHIGEHATVCGTVYGGYYAKRTKGKPTFINLDGHYPRQRFTVLIWGEQRHLFHTPERKWIDKRLCVTGTIESYRGIPEIVVYDTKQITFP